MRWLVKRGSAAAVYDRRLMEIRAHRAPLQQLLSDDSIAQLNVPIRQVHEMPPTFVLLCRECYLHEWSPFWPLRFSNKCHVGFMREPVALAGVTLDAGTDNILPCR